MALLQLLAIVVSMIAHAVRELARGLSAVALGLGRGVRARGTAAAPANPA
jgi:hypothetical protein